MLKLLAASSPLEHVVSHDLHMRWGPFEMNNQMLMALVAAILMVMLFPVIFRRSLADGRAPAGKTRNFFESILEFLRVEVIRPALKENTDRFLPFLWTLFFFILFCNLLGQIPFGEILTLVTNEPSHLGGTATGNIMTTMALAICSLIVIHASGIWQVARDLMRGTYGHHGHHEEHSSNGERGHEAAHDLEHARSEGLAADVPQNMDALGNPSKHYADDEHHKHHHDHADDGHLHDHAHAQVHGKKWNPVAALLAAPFLYLWNFAPHPFAPNWAMDVPMWFVLLILELIGAMIKPFALMIRLFANMIAGHIVLASLVGLIILAPTAIGQIGVGIPVIALSLLIRALELFVAFLQAYIFMFLTTLFIASAVAPEH
jgi:F0F1-type ATP synthase membrane subunit a